MALMPQKQKVKIESPGWLLVLIVVVVLFICLIVSKPLRYQLGGKWSLPLIGVALLAVLYIQPAVQRAVTRWRSDRRDEAEKRWWKERERRLQEGLIRDEAIRNGKISRERHRRK